jgi:hypothetical protein
MKREVSKFFCGAFAGIAYAHAGYAIAASSGIIDEPIFLGRKWGVGFMWTEAIVYSAVSVALGHVGWGSERHRPHQASVATTNGPDQGFRAAQEPLSVSR